MYHNLEKDDKYSYLVNGVHGGVESSGVENNHLLLSKMFDTFLTATTTTDTITMSILLSFWIHEYCRKN